MRHLWIRGTVLVLAVFLFGLVGCHTGKEPTAPTDTTATTESGEPETTLFETSDFSEGTVPSDAVTMEGESETTVCDHEYIETSEEATCTENGKRVTACAKCGQILTSEVLPATGHAYETTTIDATCTADGAKVTACSKCGDRSTEVISATGHAYETTTTDATCTVDGAKVTTCSKCGDSSTEIIPALGHDKTTKTTVKATCTEKGKKVTTCSRCDYTKTDSIKAKGHDLKTATIAATCTEDGSSVTTCSRCDHYESSVIPTMGHDLKTATTAATCTEDGSSVTTCSRCDHYESSVIPATGHGYGEDHRCDGCGKREPIEVIVLAGQSNAVGVGHSMYLSKHFDWREARRFRDGYENVRIRFYAHNQKNTALEPVRLGCAELNRDTFGPEVGMADYLTMNYPGREFVIVKCAFGSTTLYHDWAGPADRYQTAADGSTVRPVGGDFNREAGWCLDELYALLDETLRDLEEEGYAPCVRAFCWMQGEGDSLSSARAAAYGGLYRRMLASFDETYASYLNNCVYVDGGISTIWKYYREINAFKASFAAEAENRFYIDTIAEGLTTNNEPEGAPDIYHYDSDSVIKLGRLFASRIPLD